MPATNDDDAGLTSTHDDEAPKQIDNFPDLSQHHNCMGDVLTPEMFKRLKDLKTATGCVFVSNNHGCKKNGGPIKRTFF